MSMNRSRQDVLLGIVFFGGLATLLWATTALTDLSLQTRPELQVLFRDVSGLRVGDQTYVLGHHQGQVKEILYQPGTAPEDRIRVTLQLENELQLNTDMQITIMDASLLGSKRVEVDPGVSAEQWPPGTLLRGIVRKNGIDALGDMINGEDVSAIIEGLRSAIDNLNSSDSTIGKLLQTRRGLVDCAAFAGRALASCACPPSTPALRLVVGCGAACLGRGGGGVSARAAHYPASRTSANECGRAWRW